MKKLFFSALVATVAVGGAIAQSGPYRDVNGNALNCVLSPVTPACSTIQLYDFENPSEETTAPNPTTTYIEYL